MYRPPLVLPLALPVVLGLAFACSDDDGGSDFGPEPDGGSEQDAEPPADGGDPTPNNVLEVARNNGAANLVAAVEQAGLTETLDRGGPWTLFAPGNDAILNAALPGDSGLLANVLLHHVLAGEFDETAITATSGFTTVAGTSLQVNAGGSSVTIEGVELDASDLNASNGIVHLLAEVMRPPNIAATVADNDDLQILEDALRAVGAPLDAVLAGEGPITVFAPVNDAWGDTDPRVLDPGVLESILAYHVLEQQVIAEDLTDGREFTTFQGRTLTIQNDGNGSLGITDAAGETTDIVQTDLRLRNGTLHFIGGLLTPVERVRNSVLDVAAAAGLTRFANAARDIRETSDRLSQVGEYTVFAPSNAALQAEPLPDDQGLAANILLNHVLVPPTRTFEEVTQSSTVVTLANTVLEVDRIARTVAGVPVGNLDELDRAAENGIVHTVNGVLPAPSVLEAVTAHESLTTLATSLGAASAETRALLDGTEAITVFAPVDGAVNIEDLASASGAGLNDLLRYHVLPGQRLSSTLRDGDLLTMENGITATVSSDGGTITLTDDSGQISQVTGTDIRLRNGTVHLVNRVLAPNDLITQARANNLTSFVALAETAGLLEDLRTGGPYTVFAPSNAALGNVGVITPDGARNILLHHTVNGINDSTSVLASESLSTRLGTTLPVESVAIPTVGGAALSNLVDLEASNGFAHVLDDVIAVQSILGVVRDPTRSLSELGVALERSTRVTQLMVSPNLYAGGVPVTFFAPTDTAFARANLTGLDIDTVLRFHVVEEQFGEDELPLEAITVNGSVLTFRRLNDGRIQVVNGGGVTAFITEGPIQTLNGIVYLVSEVLLP